MIADLEEGANNDSGLLIQYLFLKKKIIFNSTFIDIFFNPFIIFLGIPVTIPTDRKQSLQHVCFCN